MKQGKRLTTEQIEQMRAYKAEGHSSAEVGIMFGVTEKTAQKYCRGISRMDSTTQFKGLTGEEVNALVKRYNQNLVYHSGFTKGDCIINVKCMKCGSVFQRSIVTLRHGRAVKACPLCYPKNKGTGHKKLPVEEKERRRVERAERHELTIAKMKAKSKEATRQRQEARRHDCPICGMSTTRPKYCSDKCSRIAYRKEHSHEINATHEASRRIKIKQNLVDTDITLKKLYSRDKEVCWICGMLCDYHDKEYKGRTMIAGNMYPSIDHVIALADGGAHSWDNVKLAHRICNTLRYYSPT